MSCFVPPADAPAELALLLEASDDLEMYSRHRRHSSAAECGESRRASDMNFDEEDRARCVPFQ